MKCIKIFGIAFGLMITISLCGQHSQASWGANLKLDSGSAYPVWQLQNLKGAQGALTFVTGTRHTLSMFENGSVGIGVGPWAIDTYSTSYKLFVKSGILAEKVRVALQTNWPDYVFDRDYSLRSLSELNTYINENGHLPDMPSAATVEKEGIDLGDMDARLLRKIEELTLYVLQLEEKIADLTN